MSKSKNSADLVVRLDKWLWAARFFKTRRLAEEAVTGGKVHFEGARTKPGKRLAIGDLLAIRQGTVLREVNVMALSQVRGPASEASTLYEELPSSIKARADFLEQRKMAPVIRPKGKPDRKQRAMIRKQLGKE